MIDVCCKIFMEFRVYRIHKKVENHWTNLLFSIEIFFGIFRYFDVILNNNGTPTITLI